MSIPGIDMAFIGSTDLAVSMGYTDGPDHPEVQKVIQKLFEKGRKLGVLMGALRAVKKKSNGNLRRRKLCRSSRYFRHFKGFS